MAYAPKRKIMRGKTCRRAGPQGQRNGARDRSKRPSHRERRGLVQLVFCSLLFTGFVGIKLLLPAQMEGLDARLTELLHRNMDLRSAFSAIGELASGNAAGLEALQEAFKVEEGLTAEAGPDVSVTERDPQEAMEFLRRFRETEPVGTTAAEIGAATQQALPENVSMEQEILGLEYCTPVQGVLTSGFGFRKHPSSGIQRFHYGIDLAAEEGTAISSFADGTVTAVGESNSYGNYCIVAHDNGIETLYAHCKEITAREGTDVKLGEKLGEVGSTGISTGTHLHFELQKNGSYLNPIYYVEK